MENQTKTLNWIEASRRLFYVAWAIQVVWAILAVFITDGWDIVGILGMILFCVAPYPLMLGVRWIYAGLRKTG